MVAEVSTVAGRGSRRSSGLHDVVRNSHRKARLFRKALVGPRTSSGIHYDVGFGYCANPRMARA
ncbi:Uncharacterised protein [Bordetella pertussis]|nr:Uncharacterised protein [Bordetella pertussis]